MFENLNTYTIEEGLDDKINSEIMLQHHLFLGAN